MADKIKHDNVLTSFEIAGLYISSVQTFADVASKAELEKGEVFVLGKRLFDEAIKSINETKDKLS